MKDCKNVFITHSLITIYNWSHVFYPTSLNTGDFSSIGWGTINGESVNQWKYITKKSWHNLLLMPYFSNTFSKLQYEENARFDFFFRALISSVSNITGLILKSQH